MIVYIHGDIFSSPAQVLVNPVNTVGIMGKGLALSFKQRYPETYRKYCQACANNHLAIGNLLLTHELDHDMLLFPSKAHWKDPSELEYIERGLLSFVCSYSEKGIISIAFPKLGCGNGGLSWDELRPLMERYLQTLPILVYIYLGR